MSEPTYDTIARITHGYGTGEVFAFIEGLRDRIAALEADLRYARESWSLLDQKLSQAEAALAEANRKYELLSRAVNASTDCLPECDTYGHADQCPYVNTAIWLERQQQALAEAKEKYEDEREDCGIFQRKAIALWRALAEAKDCQDPLDPCRGCLKCLKGMWLNEVRLRESRDEALAERTRERGAWEETAAQAYRNADYYRGLVVKIGEPLGLAARTADDGGVSEDVLCAKVPEIVKRERTEDRAAIRDANRMEYIGGYPTWQHKHAAAIQRAMEEKGK